MFKKTKKIDSYAVIGLGRFGRSLSKALHDQGAEVLAIDNQEDQAEMICDKITHVLVGDVTDEKFLESIGLNNFDCVVVAIGSDVQASILVTLKLKEMGVEYVVARARDELHSRLLQKVGADRIIQVEQDMGVKIAKSLISPYFMDAIDVAGFSLVETAPLPQWLNKPLSKIFSQIKRDTHIIAIKRGNNMNTVLSPDFVIEEGDVLIIIGKKEMMEQLR